MTGLLLALIAAAGAGEHEENGFALIAQGLEWATPDLRVEVGEGPVGTVLSWPITPVSVSVLRLAECRVHLLAEPFVEPQLRLGGDTRLLAGSQLLLASAQRGPGLLVDGAAVRGAGGWGWATGGGLAWGGGAARGVRGRFALRGRYVQVGGGSRGDISLDIGLPISGYGWDSLFRGGSVDATREWCPQPPPDELYSDGLPDEPFPDDRRWEPEIRPACDPYGCGPGMCGEMPDGCGGTMFCGSCEEELLQPGCDPYGCSPGMCGHVDDGCGGTMFCGPCEEEELLPVCDPINPCGFGVCGEQSDGCGGTVFCGECDPPACDPVDPCAFGQCGEHPDGCGGTVFCGPCTDREVCVPIACIPGTCGAQPDGCGGTNDCGPCEP